MHTIPFSGIMSSDRFEKYKHKYCILLGRYIIRPQSGEIYYGNYVMSRTRFIRQRRMYILVVRTGHFSKSIYYCKL